MEGVALSTSASAAVSLLASVNLGGAVIQAESTSMDMGVWPATVSNS